MPVVGFIVCLIFCCPSLFACFKVGVAMLERISGQQPLNITFARALGERFCVLQCFMIFTFLFYDSKSFPSPKVGL